VSGDRGCFPAWVESTGTAVPQTTSAAQVFVASTASATAGSVVSPYVFSLDVASIYTNLCVTYGTCCNTSNCNSATSIFKKSNILFLLLSGLIAKITF